MLRSGVVPIVARGGLVVPVILTCIGVYRDDRGDKEVVTIAARVANVGIPWRAIADAEDDLIVDLVIDDRVPDRAAATICDPCAIIAPCLIREFFEDRVRGGAVRFLVRVRDGVEAPVQITRFGVIGRKIAANSKLCAAIADQHIAFDDARGAGDRVWLGLVDGDLAPFDLARFSVERLKAAINHTEIDLAIIDSDAAVHDIATRFHADRFVDFWIVDPELVACDRVEGVDHRPGGGEVHDAVDDNRCRLDAAPCLKAIGPGGGKLTDVFFGDAGQPGVALLVIAAIIGQPLSRRIARICKTRFVDIRSARKGCFCAGFRRVGGVDIGAVLRRVSACRQPECRQRRCCSKAHRFHDPSSVSSDRPILLKANTRFMLRVSLHLSRRTQGKGDAPKSSGLRQP